MTKKILIIVGILATTFSIAHAAGFTALAPIPGLTDNISGSVVDSASLANFLNSLYKYLIGLAAVLAVVEIIWGGIEISTKDSVPIKMKGKERIYNAIGGLILILSPVLVFSIINPSILNLSINLPKLDTKSAPVAQPSSCPAGLLGTPPNCKAPCSNSIRTNCIPTAVVEDYYENSQAGGWCIQVKQFVDAGKTLNYYCGTEDQCRRFLTDNQKNSPGNLVTSSACALAY